MSVVIPCYNRERLVAHSIESALRQTHGPVEVILVDDGSTDRTAEVAARFAPRVRCIRIQNQGVSRARNVGFAESKGDFVQFLDSDDLLVATDVADKLALFRNFPDTDVVYSRVLRPHRHDFDADFAVPRTIAELREVGTLTPSTELLPGLGVPAPRATPSLYRRAAFIAGGGFDERLVVTENIEINYRMYLKGAHFMLLDRVGLIWRDDRTIDRLTDLERLYGEELLLAFKTMVEFARDRGHLEGELRAHFHDTLVNGGRNLAAKCRFRMSRKYFDLARRVAPGPGGSALFRALARVAGPVVAAFFLGAPRRLLR